jgi:protein-tyrosine kinase
MTDKPSEPLNLVERVAKRLAAEQSVQPVPEPATRSLIERAAQRISLDGMTPPLMKDNGKAQVAAVPVALATEHNERTNRAPAHRNDTVIPPRPGKKIHLDFRALRQNGMITPDNMASKLSNEFRGIKRKLLQKVRDPKTRNTVNNLIMVTSSLPNEGKTFSSINLALSLAAERGLQVLLIDADVVRPSVGNVFVAPPKEGLVELLGGKVSGVSDVLHRCAEVPNLAVIFAGNPGISNPELISSGKMANLCKELSARYPDRVIVIDTPPVLASPEPAILASYVHLLVMVVSSGYTDQHQLNKSLEAVSSCPNISLLLNKAPDWNEAEYTSYYGYAQVNAAEPSASPSS